MSNTLKQRKYYAITTKSGKRIPAQRTVPDEVIKRPLHFFYLNPKGGVSHITSQGVVPISKHSSICLVEKHVYQVLSGVDMYRVMSYTCHASGVEALLTHLNKQFPPFPEFSVACPSKISVEVISQ